MVQTNVRFSDVLGTLDQDTRVNLTAITMLFTTFTASNLPFLESTSIPSLPKMINCSSKSKSSQSVEKRTYARKCTLKENMPLDSSFSWHSSQVGDNDLILQPLNLSFAFNLCLNHGQQNKIKEGHILFPTPICSIPPVHQQGIPSP